MLGKFWEKLWNGSSWCEMSTLKSTHKPSLEWNISRNRLRAIQGTLYYCSTFVNSFVVWVAIFTTVFRGNSSCSFGQCGTVMKQHWKNLNNLEKLHSLWGPSVGPMNGPWILDLGIQEFCHVYKCIYMYALHVIQVALDDKQHLISGWIVHIQSEPGKQTPSSDHLNS